MRSMIAAASLAAAAGCAACVALMAALACLVLAGCIAAGPAQPGAGWRCWIEDAGQPAQLEVCERSLPAFVKTCGAGDDGAPDACECGP